MTKLDKLLRPFRKSRASSPSPHTPDLLPATANPASASASASAPAQPDLVAEVSPANLALKLAIQQHFDNLPDADKDAFREASKQNKRR